MAGECGVGRGCELTAHIGNVRQTVVVVGVLGSDRVRTSDTQVGASAVTLHHVAVTLHHVAITLHHVAVTLHHVAVTLYHVAVTLHHVAVTLHHVAVALHYYIIAYIALRGNKLGCRLGSGSRGPWEP